MSIRWKLLILFLCISIVPILVLRTMSQNASSGMGRDLAQQEELTLIKRSKTELKRMVEDHARLAGRDKSLLEAMVALQAFTVESALSKAEPAASGVQWVHRMKSFSGGGMGGGSGEGRAAKSKITISRGLTFFSPGETPPQMKTRAAKLAAVQEELGSIGRRYPELLVRQITVFESGLAAIIPGPMKLPPMFSPQKSSWYKNAIQKDSPTWSSAHLDMLNAEPVMMVAMPVHGGGGKPIGATAIVAKVENLLQKGRHLTELSPHIANFLVRPTEKNQLEVVAKEQELPRGRQWWLPKKKELMKSRQADKLAEVADSLRRSESGVKELEYEGTPSMWAYGPANWEGLALLIIVPRKDLVAEAAAARENVLMRINQHVWTTSILVAVVLGLVAVIALVVSGTVTRRLKKMAGAVTQLEKGNLRAEVDISGSDEIGALGQAFNHMLPALRERLRLKESLDLAQEVQSSLLPEKDLNLPGLQVSGVSRYCDETGGDFFDFIALDPAQQPHYVLLAGDVTGHGAPAALLMTTVRAFLRAELGRKQNLADAITAANRLLCQDTFGSGRFVTLFALEVDIPGRSLCWVNAGQHPALLASPDQGQVTQLKGAGLTMGVEPDFEYESNHLALEREYMIAITTDGIPEAMGTDAEMFGMTKMRDILLDAPSTPSMLIENVFARLAEHQKGQAQEDDYTLIAVKITP